MTYKAPHPERVPEGGRVAHRVAIKVGGKVLKARGDCAPLGGAFDDRTREYGEPVLPAVVTRDVRGARNAEQDCLSLELFGD